MPPAIGSRSPSRPRARARCCRRRARTWPIEHPDGEQPWTGQEPDGHEQQRGPCAEEGEPRQLGQWGDRAAGTPASTRRRPAASSRTARTERGCSRPSSRRPPAPSGADAKRRGERDHEQPQPGGHEPAASLDRGHRRQAEDRQERAVAPERERGGQVAHAPGPVSHAVVKVRSSRMRDARPLRCRSIRISGKTLPGSSHGRRGAAVT